MYCAECSKDLVDCDCPGIEERLASLKECKFLDPDMLHAIDVARACRFLEKFDNPKQPP